MADATQVAQQLGTGNPVSGMLSSMGAYQRSVAQEQSDPQLKAARQKEVQATQAAEATLEQTEKNIKQEGVDLANAVKPWDADAEMKKYTTPAIESFGSAASLFAVMAAAFTHRPMINALRGSAAAMNAIKKGDEDSYSKAYGAWKDNFDLAIKRHDMMMSDYRTILDLAKERPELAHAEVTSLSSQYGDDQARALAMAGEWGKLGELLNARENTALRASEIKPQLEEANMKNQVFFGIIDKWKVDHGAKVSTDDKGHVTISGGPQQVPPEVLSQAWQAVHAPQVMMAGSTVSLPADASPQDKMDAIKKSDPRAYMIANYRMPPPSGFGSNNPNMRQLYDDVFTANPNYSAPRYNEINRAVTAFGVGKQGDAVKSFNVGIMHLDTFQELAQALHNGDVSAFNAIRQEFATQFGKDAPTNFDIAKQFIASEITKAVIGAGSSGALTDREELQKNILNARSWGQLAGGIQTYKQFMAGQLKGLSQQYKSATGLDNFDDMLLPQSKAELDAVQFAADQSGFKIEQVK